MKAIENQKPYPSEVMKLSSALGFVEVYKQLVNAGVDKMKAYEQVEQQHERLFGARRYASYISYKFCIKNKYGVVV